MLQLGFVVGDLVCERSDVCGKSGGVLLFTLEACMFFFLHFFIIFFFMSASAAICLTCHATNPSSRWHPQKKYKPGSMKSDIMWPG